MLYIVLFERPKIHVNVYVNSVHNCFFCVCKMLHVGRLTEPVIVMLKHGL